MSDDRYQLTTHDGKTVDKWTKQALEEMERRLGYPLTITQGSYNRTVSASGGTHDGGGVVDLAGYDADRKAKVGREVGFIAWKRTPDQGPWGTHVHMILRGNARLSPAAFRQLSLWHQGKDGLATMGPDYGDRDVPIFAYQAPRRLTRGARIDAALKLLRKARDSAKGPRRRTIQAAILDLIRLPRR